MPRNSSLTKPAQKRYRDKIRIGRTLKQLQACIDGDVELSPQQIRAAEILLKKTLPDLQAIEHTGPDGGPLQTAHAVLIAATPQDAAAAYKQMLASGSLSGELPRPAAALPAASEAE